MTWAHSEQRRRVWWWVIASSLVVYLASFFLSVVSEPMMGRLVGWEAAWWSFEGFLEANWHIVPAVFGLRDAQFMDVWMAIAWLGNVAWVGAVFYILCPPLARRRRRVARALVTGATLIACIGVIRSGDWDIGYWAWAGSICVACAAVWWGPRRTFPPDHCQRCGYDLAGVPTCPECGTKAAIVPA